LHLLSNAGIGLPTDLWVPATEKVKPQTSEQIAGGLARTIKIKNEDYEFSLEGYYKKMNNIIDYKAGANFFDQSSNWEKQVEAGKGWSYGSELFIQKKTGKVTGWVGYTLSWTNRQFPEINFGEIFPYKYDRRHDISVVWNYLINDRIDISGTWVYGTGNAITMGLETYAGLPMPPYGYVNELTNYGSRNSFRMRSYHRMDLGINFKKKLKWGERIWNISVYNVYNRYNPFFYTIERNQRGFNQVVQWSLFPILPSISYSFKF
jgi:hypothetical protein